MSKFWEHYERAKPHMAAAVDDVRHKLVEQGWYGKDVTGNIAKDPASGAEINIDTAVVDNSVNTTNLTQNNTTNVMHRHHALYEEIWGSEPQNGDVYGKSAPQPSASPNADARKPPEPSHEPEV